MMKDFAEKGIPTDEEQRELRRRIIEGDESARHEMVLRNFPLVKSRVGFYIRKARREGADYEDLEQEGRIGLMIAVERYDENRGKFSTCAIDWIDQRIRRYIKENTSSVHIPPYIFDDYNKIKEVLKEGCVEKNNEIDWDEIAEKAKKRFGLDMKVKGIKERLRNSYDAIRRGNKSIFGKEDERVMPLEDRRNCVDEIELREVAEIVANGVLTERERQVIERRYNGKYYGEISEETGISRKTVKKDEVSALKKMRSVLI